MADIATTVKPAEALGDNPMPDAPKPEAAPAEHVNDAAETAKVPLSLPAPAAAEADQPADKTHENANQRGGASSPAVVANGLGPTSPPPPKQTPTQMPVRQYLESTVVPLLMQSMQQLVRDRPEDPVGYIADFLQRNNPKKRKDAS